MRYVAPLLRVWFGAIGWVIAAGTAHAQTSCTLAVSNASLGYPAGGSTTSDTQGSMDLQCVRAANDPRKLTYELTADGGTAPLLSAPYRRAVRSDGGAHLSYILSADRCRNTAWDVAPNGGLGGSTQFGNNQLSLSVSEAFCVRVRAGQDGNPVLPAPGLYFDQVTVVARYPADPAGSSTSAVLQVSINVPHTCGFENTAPTLRFDYSAFSPTGLSATADLLLKCAVGSPWQVSVMPSSGVLAGLRYSLSVSPVAGVGNGNSQSLRITGTMPAWQAGTCSTDSCSATAAHTMVIEY